MLNPDRILICLESSMAVAFTWPLAESQTRACGAQPLRFLERPHSQVCSRCAAPTRQIRASQSPGASTLISRMAAPLAALPVRLVKAIQQRLVDLDVSWQAAHNAAIEAAFETIDTPQPIRTGREISFKGRFILIRDAPQVIDSCTLGFSIAHSLPLQQVGRHQVAVGVI